MKKYITLALAFVICIISLSCIVCASETVISDEANQSITLLARLGITEEKSVGAKLSRSDFMGYFVNYIGKKDMITDKYNLYYTDVKYEDKNSAQISYLTEEGYINGYGDGLFYPDKNITVAQVLKLIEIATGYSSLLKSDTPSEYLRIARMMKIINGTSFSNVSDEATLGDIAIIMYNSLSVDFVDVSVIYDDGVTYKKTEGKTILSEFLKLDKYEGIITANSYTNLKGANTREGTIVINQKALNFGEYKELELDIGKYGEIYSEKDNDNIKGYVIIESKTNILEVNSRLILDKLGNTIEYRKEENSDSIVKVKIDNNAYVIYNGKYDGLFSSYSLQDITFDTGYLKLIDYNCDRTYDVVMVVEYEVFIAETIGTDFIVFKYDKLLNGMPKITLDENIDYSIKIDNEIAEINDLVEFDVLNIAQSRDASYTEISVYFKRIEGSVVSLGSSNRDSTAEIAGQELIISKSYQKLQHYDKVDITLGLKGYFYCDYNGHIAAVNADVAELYNYGYLKGVRYDTDEELTEIRVFASNGEFENYFIREKSAFYSGLYTTGTTPKPEEYSTLLLKEDGTCYQPIMYKLDSKNRIIELYLEVDNLEGNNNEYAFTKDYYSNGGTKQYAYIYRGLLAQKFKIPSSVPIMFIPADKENEEIYSANTLLTLPNPQVYNFDDGISVYNADEFNLVPKLLITESTASAGGPKVEGSICVVNSKKIVLNDKGEPVTGLEVYQKNRLLTLAAQSDEIASNEKYSNTEGTAINDWYYGTKVSDLKKGDVIMYDLDETGSISKLRVLFRPSNPLSYDLIQCGANEINRNLIDLPYVSLLVLAHGEVQRIGGGAMRMTISDAGDEWVFWTGSASVMLFDSEADSLTVASTADIQPGDEVFLRKGQDESVDDIVIIR